jgi:hypothetical protein
MSSWRAVPAMVLTDVRQRSRGYGFMITVAVTVLIALEYLPPRSAAYVTVGSLSGEGVLRGIYSSAWVGTVMACLSTVLLSLICFYQVKDTIARDRNTKIGQLIAATAMSRWRYTTGKTTSSFSFLAVKVAVIALAAVGVQLIRGEDLQVDAAALVMPFVIITLPAMALVAGLAVLFDSVPVLRRAFGNVVYLGMWLAATVICLLWIGRGPDNLAGSAGYDPFGFIVVSRGIAESIQTIYPDSDGVPRVIFFTGRPIETFVWPGIIWTWPIILGKLKMVALAAGLALISALFHDRFDPSRQIRKKQSLKGNEQVGQEVYLPLTPVVSTTRLSPLSPDQPTWLGQLGLTLLAELRIIHKELHWWWYLVASGLVVASLLVPLSIAHQFLLPAAWLWPLMVWSPLGNRERRLLTHRMIFSTPYPLQRQLPATWLAGFLVVLVAGSGVALRLTLAGAWVDLAVLMAGAAWIPALAVCLGTWSNGRRLFEVTYLLLWYAGPVNKLTAVDFMGVAEETDAGQGIVILLVALLLIGLTIVGRYWQLRRG